MSKGKKTIRHIARHLDIGSLRQGAVEYRLLAMKKGAALVGEPGYVERTLAENVIALCDAISSANG